MKFRRGCCSFELPAAGQRKRCSSVHAFTLVELLVVIGIIALLISVLLPALAAARRQAATVKCESSLRDIGNAFIMYVGDNKGWAPPAKLRNGVYTLDSGTFDGTASPPHSAYWFNFLSKYETKTSVGWASTNGAGPTAGQAADAQKSIFWGCPAWNGYIASGAAGITAGINEAGGIEVTQTGYGMNGFPEFTGSYPPKGASLGESAAPQGQGVSSQPIYYNAVNTPVYSTTYGWTPPSSGLQATQLGKWYKFTQYSHPSDRALMGDSLFWFLESLNPLPPPNFAGQYTLTNNATWASELDGGYETTFDFYRHGVYPRSLSSDMFDRVGGKVAFNVLFCDNHVATLTTKDQAYRVIRMRYPN